MKPTTDNATDTATKPARESVQVQLQTPIARAGGAITTLTIMKPRTGDLRGLMLTEVMQMKTDAIAALLQRVSVPTLIKAEVDEMDTADLVACASEVAGFLVPKAAMASLTE